MKTIHVEDLSLNFKDYSDTERYLAANLQKITSSRYLIALLKEYLEEPDQTKRQSLASRILFNIEEKE